MQESHAESASSRVSCPACIPYISPRTRISPRVHPVHIAPHANTALQRQSNAPILPINIVRFDIRRQSSVLLSSSFFHTISTCGNNNMTHACSRRISILPPNIETNCSMCPKSAAPSQKRSYRCRRTLHCTVNLCKKPKESVPLIRLSPPIPRNVNRRRMDRLVTKETGHREESTCGIEQRWHTDTTITISQAHRLS